MEPSQLERSEVVTANDALIAVRARVKAARDNCLSAAKDKHRFGADVSAEALETAADELDKIAFAVTMMMDHPQHLAMWRERAPEPVYEDTIAAAEQLRFMASNLLIGKGAPYDDFQIMAHERDMVANNIHILIGPLA